MYTYYHFFRLKTVDFISRIAYNNFRSKKPRFFVWTALRRRSIFLLKINPFFQNQKMDYSVLFGNSFLERYPISVFTKNSRFIISSNIPDLAKL